MAEAPGAALSRAGWYLSDEGIEACTSSPDKVNVNDIILIALNTDLRTIGKKFLPSDINGGKVEKRPNFGDKIDLLKASATPTSTTRWLHWLKIQSECPLTDGIELGCF